MKLRVINGGGRCQSADGRGRFPQRGLHLIDIENLAGAAWPTLEQIRGVQDKYTGRLAFGTVDHFVVASSHKTLLDAALGWPRARYKVRSGPDGADLELLDVLRHENVAGRFTRVVIGSGDGVFADAAAELTDAGIPVIVVSIRDQLSARLKLAASEVIYLDDAPPPVPVAA